MQIKRLHINNRLCLKDFEIKFNTSKKSTTTILIGENGSGKSTMLKTILDIIISFDSPSTEQNINYDYEIEYEYAERNISIKKEKKEYTVQIESDFFSKGKFESVTSALSNKKVKIFPERVIAFYSGNNKYFYDEIQKVSRRFLSRCKNAFEDYKKSIGYNDSKEPIIKFEPIKNLKRKYVYCDESFVPIYLSAFLAGFNSYEKELIKKECRLYGLDYISIILIDENIRLSGEKNRQNFDILRELYTFVEFFDYRFVELFRRGYIPSRSRRKLIFRIENIDRLNIDSITIFDLLEKLKIYYKAEYTVHLVGPGGYSKDSELSEGQRQLIKILGMLGVSKSENCIVLMDEPDAHMNPLWKYNIKEIIDNVLKLSTNTQTLIATHDPLVINGVSKEFIRIFNNENGSTEANEPDSSTEGMGIDGLLQSEYYGLPTVLDSETKKKMDEKHDLLVERKEKGGLSKDKEKRLEDLTEKLEDMTFSRNIPTDIYYEEFVAAMHKIYKERPKVTLTKEEVAERNAKAEEILRGMLKE